MFSPKGIHTHPQFSLPIVCHPHLPFPRCLYKFRACQHCLRRPAFISIRIAVIFSRLFMFTPLSITSKSLIKCFQTLNICAFSENKIEQLLTILQDIQIFVIMQAFENSLLCVKNAGKVKIMYWVIFLGSHKVFKKCVFSLQHAPYDAMVMVNVSYYVDEKVFENEGRWKVCQNKYFIIFLLIYLLIWYFEVFPTFRVQKKYGIYHFQRSLFSLWMRKY